MGAGIYLRPSAGTKEFSSPAEKQSWRKKAICSDLDTEIFYPHSGDDPSKVGRGAARQYEEAKAICRQCPVQSECLEDALEVESWTTFGVQGATDPSERREILRQRRDAAQARTAAAA